MHELAQLMDDAQQRLDGHLREHGSVPRYFVVAESSFERLRLVKRPELDRGNPLLVLGVELRPDPSLESGELRTC